MIQFQESKLSTFITRRGNVKSDLPFTYMVNIRKWSTYVYEWIDILCIWMDPSFGRFKIDTTVQLFHCRRYVRHQCKYSHKVGSTKNIVGSYNPVSKQVQSVWAIYYNRILYVYNTNMQALITPSFWICKICFAKMI